MGTPVTSSIRLVHLFEPESNRRVRVEAPVVFGRYDHFYDYAGRDGQVRYSTDEGEQLQRLDFVEVAGDPSVSRNHCVFDPANLTVRDLNSSNGTYVNEVLIPTHPERIGPERVLKVGDVLRVGQMRFVVEEGNAGLHTHCGQLSLDRHAIVAPVGTPTAGVTGELLRQRKWFKVHEARTPAEVLQLLDETRPRMGNLGIMVVTLVAEPVGDALRWGGEVVSAASLIRRLNALPGSKVLALHATADPAAFERVFCDRAQRDTLLITSTVPVTAGVDPGVEECFGTVRAEACRQAVGGVNAPAFHSVLDGLDALISADTNVLNLEWVNHYEGALNLIAGTYQRRSRLDVEVCYGTDGTVGSARVRHHFETPINRGSSLVGSW